MKVLFLVLALAPFTARAGERFVCERGFSSLGGGLLDDSGDTANTCVTGDKRETALEPAEVTYRLRTARSRSGAYTLRAEMFVVVKRTDLSSPRAGLGAKVAAERFPELCGEKYVAADLEGARQAFGMGLGEEEAAKVPAIELKETGGVSRAQEFAELVESVTEKSLGRRASWPMRESAGPLGRGNASGLGPSFEEYRELAIRSPEKAAVVLGESSVYSPALIRAMVK